MTYLYISGNNKHPSGVYKEAKDDSIVRQLTYLYTPSNNKPPSCSGVYKEAKDYSIVY